MKDLELLRGFEIPGENRNYRRLDNNTLRSSNRAEDRALVDEVTPSLRGRQFPVYSTKYIPRETISSTVLGIEAAIQELQSRGFREEVVFHQSWIGGVTESDLRE